MNYYNPYLYTIPSSLVQPKVGLLGRLFGTTGVSISNFLNGTQKVLNIANQTIPLVKQAKPMISNAKTMLRVMSEFKKTNLKTSTNTADQNNITNKNINTNTNNNNVINNQGPQFFI